MTDYSKGQIYKLTCETGAVYIGSTVQPLNQRLCIHKNKSSRCASKNFINPKIQLIELYPCNTKSELLWRERAWFDTTDCVNICRPISTVEENNEISRLYRLVHRDELNEKAREKNKCECGGKYSLSHKSHHSKTKKHIAYLETL